MTTTEDALSKLTERTLGGLRLAKAAEQTAWINAIIYGDSGVGKTRLAGSACVVPDMAPVLFIDVEGGTLTIRDLYPDIDVVRVQSWRDFVKLYNHLYDTECAEYRTIVIDSITELQKFTMDRIMDDVVKKDSSRDREVPSQREWGMSLEQTRSTIRGFRDLPCHTILTALAIHDKNSRGKTENRVSLPGKLSNEASGFFDLVAYYYMNEIEGAQRRMLCTTKTETTIAKDRSNKLPQIVDEPTMELIHETMFSQGG